MATDYVEPFYTDAATENKDKLITYGLIVFLAFMYLFVIQMGGTYQEVANLQTATALLLFFTFASLIAVGKRPQIYVSYGLPNKTYSAIAIGAVVAILIGAWAGFSIATPLSVITTSNAILLFYAMIVVPLAEERFFGRTLPYVIYNTKIFGNNDQNQWFTIIASASVFSVFHLISYQADIVKMMAAFSFRVLVLIGNTTLKSGAFGDSLHMFNNIILGLRQIKAIGL